MCRVERCRVEWCRTEQCRVEPCRVESCLVEPCRVEPCFFVSSRVMLFGVFTKQNNFNSVQILKFLKIFLI